MRASVVHNELSAGLIHLVNCQWCI